MVVKTAIISTLAFHILLNAFEAPLFFLKLPVEQFQFTSGPFDSVPAPIHPDLPALRQCKLRFAEAERFGKRGDLTLLLVYPDSHGFEPPHNLMPHPLGFFDGWKDQNIVVHKMRSVFGFSLTEHPVVD